MPVSNALRRACRNNRRNSRERKRGLATQVTRKSAISSSSVTDPVGQRLWAKKSTAPSLPGLDQPRLLRYPNGIGIPELGSASNGLSLAKALETTKLTAFYTLMGSPLVMTRPSIAAWSPRTSISSPRTKALRDRRQAGTKDVRMTAFAPERRSDSARRY